MSVASFLFIPGLCERVKIYLGKRERERERFILPDKSRCVYECDIQRNIVFVEYRYLPSHFLEREGSLRGTAVAAAVKILGLLRWC